MKNPENLVVAINDWRTQAAISKCEHSFALLMMNDHNDLDMNELKECYIRFSKEMIQELEPICNIEDRPRMFCHRGHMS